ncbi:hypothetical protein [Bifidobacterium thermacidophilum]|uniref:hypothetical protein n=1 Tax=Bifidobacterium thermacidophilum TaxID=246618 RepID=UPI003F08A406
MKQCIRSVVAAVIAIITAAALAGCGTGGAGNIHMDSVKDAADRLVKAIASGDAKTIMTTMSKDTQSRIKLLKVKPDKPVTDVKVSSVSDHRATIAYKIAGKSMTTKIGFELQVDNNGEPHYYVEDIPFVWANAPDTKIGGVTIPYLADNAPQAYVLPGEYHITYEDDVASVDTNAPLGLAAAVNFETDKTNHSDYVSRNGINLFTVAKQGKGYKQALSNALDDIVNQQDCAYVTWDNKAPACEAAFGTDSEVDISQVTVMPGSRLDDPTFSGTVRLAILPGGSYLVDPGEEVVVKEVDINQLEPVVTVQAPADSEQGVVTLTVELTGIDSVIHQLERETA